MEKFPQFGAIPDDHPYKELEKLSQPSDNQLTLEQKREVEEAIEKGEVDQLLERNSQEMSAEIDRLFKDSKEKIRKDTLTNLQEGERRIEADLKGPRLLRRITDKLSGVEVANPEVRESIMNGSLEEVMDTLRKYPRAIKDYYVRSPISSRIVEGLRDVPAITPLIQLVAPQDWPEDNLKNRVFDYIRYTIQDLERNGNTEEVNLLKEAVIHK